jgi:hypothetical protein
MYIRECTGYMDGMGGKRIKKALSILGNAMSKRTRNKNKYPCLQSAEIFIPGREAREEIEEAGGYLTSTKDTVLPPQALPELVGHRDGAILHAALPASLGIGDKVEIYYNLHDYGEEVTLSGTVPPGLPLRSQVGERGSFGRLEEKQRIWTKTFFYLHSTCIELPWDTSRECSSYQRNGHTPSQQTSHPI